jgi:hypothetical protein
MTGTMTAPQWRTHYSHVSTVQEGLSPWHIRYTRSAEKDQSQATLGHTTHERRAEPDADEGDAPTAIPPLP